MIDFHLNISQEAQLWHFFFFLFFYLLSIVTNRKCINGEIFLKKGTFPCDLYLVIGLLVLTIAPYTQGDFYHYAEIVQKGGETAHLENFYVFLVDLVDKNYLLWRIIVWGGATLLMFLCSLRLGISLRYTFLVLFICYITTYSYARATFAFSVYCFGLSFLLKPCKNLTKRILSYLLGAVIILCSHFFHSSAIVLIAVTALLVVPMNKYTIPIYIVLAIVSAGLLYSIIVERLLLIEGEAAEVIADKYLYSAESTSGTFSGVSALLNYVLEFGSFYIPFILISKNLYYQKEITDSLAKGLYKIIFGIIVIATLFGVVIGSWLFFYRVLYMSMIPISIEIAYLYTTGIMKAKDFRICVNWGCVAIMYWHLYGIYCRII